MGEEERLRRAEREHMVKNAIDFARSMGREVTESAVRKETYEICERVEKKRDRNIKDRKDK